MKYLLTLIAILPLSVALSSCGEAKGVGASAANQAAGGTASDPSAADPPNAASVPRFPGIAQYPGDVDGDNDHNSDEHMLTPGHEANAAQVRVITATIKRYYASAVAGDGARACAMLAAPILQAVPLEDGRYGAPYLHGHTCAEVLSKLFEHFHSSIVTEAARFKVAAVRLEGDHGYAALRTHIPCIPERCVLDRRILTLTTIVIKQEGSSWKIESLLAQV